MEILKKEENALDVPSNTFDPSKCRVSRSRGAIGKGDGLVPILLSVFGLLAMVVEFPVGFIHSLNYTSSFPWI